jgi:hypothetical protein
MKARLSRKIEAEWQMIRRRADRTIPLAGPPRVILDTDDEL